MAPANAACIVADTTAVAAEIPVPSTAVAAALKPAAKPTPTGAIKADTAIPMPKLPSEIQNRLPKIDILGGAFGSIDLAQGELDLDLSTGDQVVYECTLIGAFPTTRGRRSQGLTSIVA